MAEFSRTGVDLENFSGLCTMRLAGDCGFSNGARNLAHLCWELSIPLLDAHSAGNDARMCASILKRVAERVDLADLAQPVTCRTLWKRQPTPLGITRQKARETPIKSPLQTIAHRLNGRAISDVVSAGQMDEYLLVLDRVLEDRVVNPEEAEELIVLAGECGISPESVTQVHEHYLASLAALVVSDGIVTEDERRDLNRVAGLLGIGTDAVHRLLEHPVTANGFLPDNLAGKTVCFTGEHRCCLEGEQITRENAEALAAAAGLTILPRVTKKLDILVVADPDTASGKAKKAREYGVRIIAERPFWQKLGLAAV